MSGKLHKEESEEFEEFEELTGEELEESETKDKIDESESKEELPKMRIEKIHEDSVIPTKATESDAGYDLYAYEDVVIPPSGKVLVSTGIKVQIPKGYYGRIAPRSSMAWKKHTDVGAGVIDSGYRGEVKVVLFNLQSCSEEIMQCMAADTPRLVYEKSKKRAVHIKKNDRIAQLIITPYQTVSIEEGSVEDSERGEGAFGSSGV